MKTKMNYTDIKLGKSPKPKSCLKIGNEIPTKMYTDSKFNRFQKFMWKILLNIKIEDVED